MRSYYTYVFLLCASPSVLIAMESDILNVRIKSSDKVECSVPAEPLERYSVLWQGYKEVWRSTECGLEEFNNVVHPLPHTSEELALKSIVGLLQQADDHFNKKSNTYVQLLKKIPPYKESEMIRTLESAGTIFRLDERILKALALKCVSDKKESVLDLCWQVPNSVNNLIGQFFLRYGRLPEQPKGSVDLLPFFQGISSTDLVVHNKLSIDDRGAVWLGFNHLAYVDGDDLPEGTTCLDLSQNQLTSLPDNLPQGIRWLYLRNNQLTSLPDNLPQGIIWLDLRNNQLTSEAKDNIRKRLPNATIIFE